MTVLARASQSQLPRLFLTSPSSSSVSTTLAAANSRLSSVSRHLSMSAPSSSAAGNQSASSLPPITFEKSPIPESPLGSGRFVKTAGCLIIGDEVLNGKTKDSNSNYFAKFCFSLGISLKRIEVIADDTDEIVEAARRMTQNYDLVITSGGIGPTHDDITYESIAKAFHAEPLQLHDETWHRMSVLNKRRNLPEQTEDMITARKRMAQFPSGKDAEVLFVTDNLWVPVVRLQGKLCILPGVPRLFEALLDGLASYIPIDKDAPRPFRVLVKTKHPESSIAPFLTKLSQRVKAEEISVGSYPKLFDGVEVSLIGTDLEALKKYGEEVAKELDGTILDVGKLGDDPK